MAVRPLLPGEYAVLALLALRPMHGYEMTAFIEEEGLADVCPVEQSTLYTYLRNVEARGLVAWTEERVGNRPPRKRFELTPAGRDLIGGWLRRPVERMREVRLDLLVKLFFLERTDPAAHARLLRDQVAACERYLAGLDAAAPAGGFQRLVARSKRTAAEATLDWLRGYAAEVEAREANP
ncbi:MAG TPA: helix-turn-helix transcriptional regulator [Tepidiformaceae bacterium]|jgi:PadR family transcriptional regulator PadR|nr:helix-turn-helix transcriptional regulator [Tepidiformaceae bacterium]